MRVRYILSGSQEDFNTLVANGTFANPVKLGEVYLTEDTQLLIVGQDDKELALLNHIKETGRIH